MIVVALTASIGCRNCSVSIIASASSASLIDKINLSISAALIKGSSPIIITYSSASIFCATSATRSVPVRCLSDVIITFIPSFWHASTIIWLSVATITSSNMETFFASLYTHQTIDLPQISASGLPGKRDDLYLAGMTPITFIMLHLPVKHSFYLKMLKDK